MRGVVTLAAAFIIPPSTPHRDVLLLIAFTVTAGTLFLQGMSLPWVARRLKVPSPDPTADALARANLLHQASTAGLAELEQLEEEDPHAVGETMRDRVRRRDYAAWERVGRRGRRDPERDLRPAAQADDRRRAQAGPGDPDHRHRRARGGRGGAGHARRRGVDARLQRATSASGSSRRVSPIAFEGGCETCRRSGRRSSRTPPASAATACARERRGCTCGCAWTAATSPAATPPRSGTPASTSSRPTTR